MIRSHPRELGYISRELSNIFGYALGVYTLVIDLMPSDLLDYAHQNAKHIADPGSDEFRLENSLFYKLAHVENAYETKMQASLKTIDMDLPSWRVLMVLHEKQPSTISEIAKHATMKLSTMTKVAQRMEKKSLLRLAQNAKDARSTDVFLTHQGTVAVVQIRSVASRIYAQATQEFEDHEITTLNHLLNQLFNALH